jgi:hypothetical protein
MQSIYELQDPWDLISFSKDGLRKSNTLWTVSPVPTSSIISLKSVKSGSTESNMLHLGRLLESNVSLGRDRAYSGCNIWFVGVSNCFYQARVYYTDFYEEELIVSSLSACCRSSSRHSLSAYGSETALDLFLHTEQVCTTRNNYRQKGKMSSS